MLDVVRIARSTDGGLTFPDSADLGEGDQPTIVTGPGGAQESEAVCITFGATGVQVIFFAEVSALGMVGVDMPTFQAQLVSSPNAGAFPDLVIGPNGELATSYQSEAVIGGPNTRRLYTFVDSDGPGQPSSFTQRSALPQLGIFGGDDNLYITPQVHRGVSEQIEMAWDRSGGPLRNRIYFSYTDIHKTLNSSGQTVVNPANDTDVMLRYSDDSGAHWSDPVRVHDDSTTSSQFHSSLSVDQTSGEVAVGYYDARGDPANTKVCYYVSISRDGGRTFARSLRASIGSSNANLAPALPQQAYSGTFFDFGDYTAGDFFNGILMLAWADNSNSTGDNPQVNAMELYTARLRRTR